MDNAELVQLLDVFTDMGSRISEATSGAGALAALVDVAVAVVPSVDHASCTTGHGSRYRTLGASDSTATRADLIQYDLLSGPCVDAVDHDGPFTSGDLSKDTRWPVFGPRVARELGINSVLSIRLTLEPEDPTTGLNMYSRKHDAFENVESLYGVLMATHGALAVTRDRANQLAQAVRSNRQIGIAVGILMTQHKITDDQAFDLLRIASQNTNRKLVDVAIAVAETGALELPTRSGSPGSRRR